MDEKMQQEYGKKMQAAQVLGCEIVQTYEDVKGQMFVVVRIIKSGVVLETFSVPMKKEELIATLNQNKENAIQQRAIIEAEIAKIEAVSTGIEP